MLAADPPAAIVTLPVDRPAEVVVVSRDTRSDILSSLDTPLPLVKGRRTEDALLRQAISLTSTLTVVRPASGTGEQTLRWTYQPYLQRQLCFTSITGEFSCATAEAEGLAQKVSGEGPSAATQDQAAPVPVTPVQVAPGQAMTVQAKPGASPAAEAARVAISTELRDQAALLFDDDRRLKLSPMLKAAGVSIRRPPVAAGSVRR